MCYNDLLSRFIDPVTGKMSDFDAGYLTGLVVALLVILLLLVLRVLFWLLLRPRRCKGIEIKEVNGNVFIAAEAVSDLIVSLQSEFPDMVFKKIRLFRKGKRQRAVIYVSFSTRNSGMTEQRLKLKERIIEVMGSILGVSSLCDICIHCSSIKVPVELPHVAKEPEMDDENLIEDAPQGFRLPLEPDK